MNKFLTVTFVFLFLSLSTVAEVSADDSQYNSTMQLVSLTRDRIELKFTPIVTVTTSSLATNKTYTIVDVANGSHHSDAAGMPDVPVIIRWIGLPNANATATVALGVVESKVKDRQRLAPVPAYDPEDPSRVLYRENTAAYQSTAAYPNAAYAWGVEKRINGLRFRQLRIYPAQFYPATQKIKYNTEINVTVSISDTSPFTAPTLALAEKAIKPGSSTLSGVINADIVKTDLKYQTAHYHHPDGFKFLIVTTTDLGLAAERLAVHKTNAMGIKSEVLMLPYGSSNTDIDEAIDLNYARTDKTLEYLLIFGGIDALQAGLFYPEHGDGEVVIKSDYAFGDADDDGVVDLGMGRMTPGTLEDANALVDKIIAYETATPLAGNRFYDKVITATHFLDVGSKASLTVFSNVENTDGIKYQALKNGTEGNSIQVEQIKAVAANAPTTATYFSDSNIVRIVLGTNAAKQIDPVKASANNVVAIVNGNPDVSSIVIAGVIGNGESVQTESELQFMVGGTQMDGVHDPDFASIQDIESVSAFLERAPYRKSVSRAYSATFYDPLLDTLVGNAVVPATLTNGNPLPNNLLGGVIVDGKYDYDHGFHWSGSQTMLNDVIDSGAFLVLYNNHGQTSGWINPQYKNNNDTIDLSNRGKYPVVISIACDTGNFASPTESFAETLVNMHDAGAIGVVAATGAISNGPGGSNSFYKYLIDGLYDDFVAESSHDGVPIRTLGAWVNYAKDELAKNQSSPDNVLYLNLIHSMHLIGDPTVAFPVEAVPE